MTGVVVGKRTVISEVTSLLLLELLSDIRQSSGTEGALESLMLASWLDFRA